MNSNVKKMVLDLKRGAAKKRVTLFVSAGLLLLGLVDAYGTGLLIGADKPLSLAAYICIVVLLIVSYTAYFHVLDRKDSQIRELRLAEINERKQRRTLAQQIYERSVQALDDADASQRLSAIYMLHELATDDDSKRYHRLVTQVLCGYVRDKTRDKAYMQANGQQPTAEIQAIIDLLFKDTNNTKGIYLIDRFDDEDFPNANLSNAYLRGADFSGGQCRSVDFKSVDLKTATFKAAECLNADFHKANCTGVDFSNSQCQRASFAQANCTSASFAETSLHVANFEEANLQKANFKNAQCHGTFFRSAECQKANFDLAICEVSVFRYALLQGSSFVNAQCLGAAFSGGQCQGMDFSQSRCHLANFEGSSLQGAVFIEAECHGAAFDDAECQGVDFSKAVLHNARLLTAKLQGAVFKGAFYATSSGGMQHLSEENFAEQDEFILEGKINKPIVQSIENAQSFLPKSWYQKMQDIIEANASKSLTRQSISNQASTDTPKDLHQLMQSFEYRKDESVQRYSSF